MLSARQRRLRQPPSELVTLFLGLARFATQQRGQPMAVNNYNKQTCYTTLKGSETGNPPNHSGP